MHMYKIADLVWREQPADLPKPFVHPFYETLFRRVYGLEKAEAQAYIGQHGPLTETRDFLMPLVKEVWDKHRETVTQFLDIRTSEEAGQAALEYAILQGAGIRNISPICIRGMGSMALLVGLQIFDAIGGDCAVVLLSELEHGFSARLNNTACAFALYSQKVFDRQEGIWITDYRTHITADEMYAAVSGFNGAVIFTEIELEAAPADCRSILHKGQGLTMPLRLLYAMLEEVGDTEALSVHATGSTYGLVYYYVFGKEEGCHENSGGTTAGINAH